LTEPRQADDDQPTAEPADEPEPAAVATPPAATSPEAGPAARPAPRAAGTKPPVRRSIIASVVVIACGYELVAEAVNRALEEPVLPSAVSGIGSFRGRKFVARLIPAGAGVAVTLAGGYAVGVVTRGRFSGRRR
jgi:hypothetical protein